MGMWEGNVKMDLKKWKSIDWMAECCEHNNEPSRSIKCGDYMY
jgi:hypothetical protein